MDVLYISSFVLFYLAFCINLIMTSRFFINIYQNNKCNSELYKEWLKENMNIILPRILISLIPVIIINVNHEAGIIIAGIIYIISSYLYQKTEIVKNSNLDDEIKKIGIILLIYFVIIIMSTFFLFDRLVLVSLILAVSYVSIPFIVLISGKMLKLHNNS